MARRRCPKSHSNSHPSFPSPPIASPRQERSRVHPIPHFPPSSHSILRVIPPRPRAHSPRSAPPVSLPDPSSLSSLPQVHRLYPAHLYLPSRPELLLPPRRRNHRTQRLSSDGRPKCVPSTLILKSYLTCLQGPSSEAGPSSPGISGTPAAYPKSMLKSMNWIMPSPINNDKEKVSAALWEQGLSAPSEESKTPCTRHLRQGCKVHTCITPSLPRSERSSIGAGLDSRRSRLDIFSDSTEAEEGRARMLNVLSEFVRLSALLSSEITSGPSSSSSSPPRKEWYHLLALILTRAVLEGYILHGWRGTRAAQVLFGFGGSNAKAPIPRKTRQNEDEDSESSDDEDEEAEFSPDGYPTLGDAYRNLFPSSPSTGTSSTEYLEELRAFREEMGRRRSEVSFFSISTSSFSLLNQRF
jgi:hypothetical protein